MYPTSIGAHHMRVLGSQAHMDELGLKNYEVVPPPEVRMMSEVLRRSGYYVTNNAKQDYQFVPPVTAWDETSSRAHWRKSPGDKPFFSIFNFEVTHESNVWRPYRRGLSRFLDPDFPFFAEEPEWGELIPEEEWTLNIASDQEVPIPPYLPDTEAVKKDVRRVYSNIVEMDRQVGAVLKQLEEDGLLDKTIIVFYSDHGGPLPRQKRLMYDSGLHVPMIIRYPDKMFAGKTDDQLISFIDLAPTMFSLAGIEPPDHLEGQAFLGPYRAEEPRKYIHAAADRLDTEYDMIRAVKDKRFKYLRNFRPEQGYYLAVEYREQMATMQELLRLRDEGQLNDVQMQWFRPSKPIEELFDTQADPHELNNLAGDPSHKAKLEELRAECERWMLSVSDKGMISEGDWIARMWPGMKQPRTSEPRADRDGGLVKLTSDSAGASIGYQIVPKGADPTRHWEVYTEAVALPEGNRLVAVAHRIGFKPSEVVEF
jgi:arylsulfatase A-like enzyme